MSIDACIAHAISSDLDILEALPELSALPVDELEPYIERFVIETQESMRNVIASKGDRYLKSKDAAGLCAACLESGLGIPPGMLLRMCQTIMQLMTVEARFILDTDDGTSLFYVRMAVEAA